LDDPKHTLYYLLFFCSLLPSWTLIFSLTWQVATFLLFFFSIAITKVSILWIPWFSVIRMGRAGSGRFGLSDSFPHDDDNISVSYGTRGVQTVGSVQTEIIICIWSFFGLSNYEPNQTFKNINRINRKPNKLIFFSLSG
jgi:hypothetical protein